MGIGIDFDRINEDVINNINISIEELDFAILGVYGLPHDDIMPPELNIGDRLSTIIETLTSIKTTISNNVEQLIQNEQDNMRLLASFLNGVIGYGTGIAGSGENILDFFAMLGMYTVGTEQSVAMRYAGLYGESDAYMEDMRNGTMSFVSNEYVQSMYEDFYANSELGRLLAQKAYGYFKPNGEGTNTLTELGNMTGTVAFGSLLGGGVFGGTVAGGVIGAGRQIEDIYQQMEKYAGGEEWRTNRNALLGLGSALGVGAWEGMQYYLGAKLSDPQWASWAKSLLNVGTDAGFNALDPAVEAGLDYAALNGAGYDVEGDIQGGTGAVLVEDYDMVLNAMKLGSSGLTGQEVLEQARTNIKEYIRKYPRLWYYGGTSRFGF